LQNVRKITFLYREIYARKRELEKEIPHYMGWTVYFIDYEFCRQFCYYYMAEYRTWICRSTCLWRYCRNVARGGYWSICRNIHRPLEPKENDDVCRWFCGAMYVGHVD